MRHLPLYLLMLTLSALDLAGTGAFYFSLHEIKSFYNLSEVQLNLLVFPPAIITIILITQNLRLIDSLGRKEFLTISLVIYVIGCALGLIGNDYTWLLTARCVMAVGAAGFVTTARNLTYEFESHEERMRGIKYYASGLAIGMALGPYIASNLLESRIFRGAFIFLGLLSVACIILNIVSRSPMKQAQSHHKHRYQSISSAATMLTPLIFSLLILTIAPISYTHADVTTLTLTAAAAWTALSVVIYGFKNSPDRLGIEGLWKMSRAYRMGIIFFCICFIIIGFNSFYVFNVFKDMEHLAWNELGYTYSAGFISSLAAWLFMFHLVPKAKTSKPFWMMGIVLFIVYLALLTSVIYGFTTIKVLMVAVATLGVATMFVLASTSMLTFSELQEDRHQFGHALQIKNVFGQFFTLIGVVASQLVFF